METKCNIESIMGAPTGIPAPVPTGFSVSEVIPAPAAGICYGYLYPWVYPQTYFIYNASVV